MEDKGIEVIEAHSITEEAFENLGEESTPENVSSKSALNKTLEKRTTSIDQTEKNPSNDCEKTEIFYCHSCGVDDWFDCLCSDSENESQSDKKAIKNNETKSDKKGIDMSPDSRDLEVETNREKEEIKVKQIPTKIFCNFNDECGAQFNQKQGLKRHIDTIHLKLKPHKCTDCSSAFNQKKQLQYHMNGVHLKIKPFKCDECPSAFSSWSNRKNHVKWVHEKEKSHKCDDCGSSFVQRLASYFLRSCLGPRK